MEINWGKHKPDWLDLQCDKVFESLKDIDSIYDKLSVIQQVLDYLQQDVYEIIRESQDGNTRTSFKE